MASQGGIIRSRAGVVGHRLVVQALSGRTLDVGRSPNRPGRAGRTGR